VDRTEKSVPRKKTRPKNNGGIAPGRESEIMTHNLKRGPLADATDAPAAPVRPSATLVLVRDGAAAMEVLLLRRGRQLKAFAGAWAFPGGATDPIDGPTDGWEAMPAVARHTAVRELREETGLTIQPDALVPLSRWTAPVIMPRRFDTWFFMAAAPAGRVQIDRSEIHDHRWASPRQALQDHQAGHIVLAPPTWVTLHHLTRFGGCDAALAAAGAQAPFHYAPRVVQQGPDSCFLYGGDQAYATLRIDQAGPRHRLWVRRDGWQYERFADDGRSAKTPSVAGHPCGIG
jgi:8-oxo-dGTP pyrophosphatase MutT (NUDIX family)